MGWRNGLKKKKEKLWKENFSWFGSQEISYSLCLIAITQKTNKTNS